MPSRPGTCSYWSISILAKPNLPRYSSLNFSYTGAIALQGPHHAAQKSTITGMSDFSTFDSKSWSVTWNRFGCVSIILFTHFHLDAISDIEIIIFSQGTSNQVNKAVVNLIPPCFFFGTKKRLNFTSFMP